MFHSRIPFVGGPYAGIELPVAPWITRLRLPNLHDRAALVLEALIKDAPHGDFKNWPHQYLLDERTQPPVFRFASSSE